MPAPFGPHRPTRSPVADLPGDVVEEDAVAEGLVELRELDHGGRPGRSRTPYCSRLGATAGAVSWVPASQPPASVKACDDHDLGRGPRRPVDRRRYRQLQPARQALGAADLRPGVPHAGAGRRCTRCHPGNLPPGVPLDRRVPRPGEVLVLALSHRAQPVPRLDAEGAPRPGGPGARRRRRHRDGVGAGSGRVDRGRRRPAEPERARAARHGAALGGAAQHHHPEGVPGADLSGDRRPAGMPPEHGQDAPLPGPHGPAARAGPPGHRIPGRREGRAPGAGRPGPVTSPARTTREYRLVRPLPEPT